STLPRDLFARTRGSKPWLRPTCSLLAGGVNDVSCDCASDWVPAVTEKHDWRRTRRGPAIHNCLFPKAEAHEDRRQTTNAGVARREEQQGLLLPRPLRGMSLLTLRHGPRSCRLGPGRLPPRTTPAEAPGTDSS